MVDRYELFGAGKPPITITILKCMVYLTVMIICECKCELRHLKYKKWNSWNEQELVSEVDGYTDKGVKVIFSIF